MHDFFSYRVGSLSSQNLNLAAVHEKLFLHKTVMGSGLAFSLYFPRDPFAETVKDFAVLVVGTTSHQYDGSGILQAVLAVYLPSISSENGANHPHLGIVDPLNGV